MCFSAQASFTSGAVLTAIGVATVAQAKKPEQCPFACIPLLFGVQQFAEGVLWLTLKSGAQATLQNAAMYVFLTAALVIWPTMIPVSVRLMEKEKTRKKILAGLIGVGGVLSLFYVVCLCLFQVAPQINGFHIQYVDDFPGALVRIAFVLYLIATIVPLFVSSVKRMWVFGVLIAVSCIVTGIFFTEYLTSVWCFFAALISIAIFWVLLGMRRRTEPLPEKSAS
jgi:hypothetical protein